MKKKNVLADLFMPPCKKPLEIKEGSGICKKCALRFLPLQVCFNQDSKTLKIKSSLITSIQKNTTGRDFVRNNAQITVLKTFNNFQINSK